MERRDFLKTGMAATAMALSGLGVAEAAAEPRLVGLIPEHLNAVLAGKVPLAGVEALYISPDTKRVLIAYIAAKHTGKNDTNAEHLKRFAAYNRQVNAMLDSGVLRQEIPRLTHAEWGQQMQAWKMAMATA